MTCTTKPAIDRLHQFAVAVKAATDRANTALQQTLPPGEIEDDLAAAVLDDLIVAVVDATLAACAVEDSQWRNPLAVLPWVIGAPAGYGGSANVFFCDGGMN